MDRHGKTSFFGFLRGRRAAEAVFAAVVLGYLLSFPVRAAFRWRVAETVTLDGENRAATPFPDLAALSAKEWGKGVEAWYNDAMPSRKWLLKRARSWHLKKLFSPFGVYVPGRGGQWFRTGKEWPELEDYLGAFRLSGEALDRWADLFAGRKAWAEAMGCTFVSVVSPEKVQTMPSATLPWLARHRGKCLFEQLESRLEELGEAANVLSVRDALLGPGDGRPLFLKGADHHPDAEGLYRIYEAIAGAVPGCGVVPWFGGEPPQEVAAGRAPGCWSDGERLRVSSPGAETHRPDILALAPESSPAPNQRSASVRRDGGGLHIVLAHTSYLRYTLASWNLADLPVRFPFDEKAGRVDSLLWKFLGDGDLDRLTNDSVPDAIVQEINEWHLSQFPAGYSEAKRNAAAFWRAEPVAEGGNVPEGAEVCVRAILADVEAGGFRGVPLNGKCPCATATLLRDGQAVASVGVNPGFRRPVFFPPVSGGGVFSVEMGDGHGTVESVSVRIRNATTAVRVLSAEARKKW
jgi:hypothetical protein